jgi:KaiC/GvpD/RAD55 family RecA-like ATPase
MSDRYESAKGWDPYEKIRKAAERTKMMTGPFELPFVSANADECAADEDHTEREQLFGPLWRSGEVAVLFGESGVGKSLLAVQVAESSAHSLGPAKRVVLFDFERTGKRFNERYTDNGVRHAFPDNLEILTVGDFAIPERFAGNINKYFQMSIQEAALEREASAIVIDNIDYMLPAAAGNAACIRIMKTLRLWANQSDCAILVVAHARARRKGERELTAAYIAGSPRIGDHADSVFAIARSSMGTKHRYIKHLKSNSGGLALPDGIVMACTLGRISRPETLAACFGDIHSEIVEYPRLPAVGGRPVHFDPSDDAQPFIGLNPIGPSHEHNHHRNYAAEARATKLAESRQIKRIRTSTTEMMLSREYARYLEG